MRFVTRGRLNHERYLSEFERVAIKQFEKEQADFTQTKVVGDLLEEAHAREWWLECVCCSKGSQRPLVAPVKLEGVTYFWRMLNGPTRVAHTKTCFFHRRMVRQEQSKAWAKKRRVRHDGYFAVLKDGGDVEPKKADTTTGKSESSGTRLPAIAKMLHGLIEKANLHVWSPNANEGGANSSQFNELFAITEGLQVAPGVSLNKAFSKYAPEWDRVVYKRLRETQKLFPKGHRPQSFICYYVQEVNRAGAVSKMKVKGQETEIDIRCAGTVKYPVIHGNIVPGPYLFFGVVGETSQKRGLELQKAYAQPIVSYNHFVAIDSNYERKAFFTLKFTVTRLQKTFSRYEWRLEKPLFEYDTPEGPCLPDFLIIAKNKSTGEELTFVIEVMGFDRASYFAGKEITHPRMETLGPLVEMDGKKFDTDKSGDGKKVTDFIMDHMANRKWG